MAVINSSGEIIEKSTLNFDVCSNQTCSTQMDIDPQQFMDERYTVSITTGDIYNFSAALQQNYSMILGKMKMLISAMHRCTLRLIISS